MARSAFGTLRSRVQIPPSRLGYALVRVPWPAGTLGCAASTCLRVFNDVAPRATFQPNRAEVKPMDVIIDRIAGSTCTKRS